MNKEIKKEYSNGEITVVWQPAKCIHAGVCTSMLPKVYNPNERPWIKIDNASTEELKNQVSNCPSGALSFYLNDSKTEEPSSSTTYINIMANGPLLINGDLEVKDADGNIENKSKTTAFCRCGASGNKPYCDGSHIGINFIG